MNCPPTCWSLNDIFFLSLADAGVMVTLPNSPLKAAANLGVSGPVLGLTLPDLVAVPDFDSIMGLALPDFTPGAELILSVELVLANRTLRFLPSGASFRSRSRT